MLQELKFLFGPINPSNLLDKTSAPNNNFNKARLLELEDIQLSDIEEERQDEATIKSLKKKNAALMPELEMSEEEKEKLELKKKRKLRNHKYGLYEFLVYLVFQKSNNLQIKNEAV